MTSSAENPKIAKLKETIKRINASGFSAAPWINGREKRKIGEIVGKWVMPQNVAIIPSKLYKTNECFIGVGDKICYKVASGLVNRKIKELQEALDEAGLDWSAVAIKIVAKQSKGNNRYYDLEARFLVDENTDKDDFPF